MLDELLRLMYHFAWFRKKAKEKGILFGL